MDNGGLRPPYGEKVTSPLQQLAHVYWIGGSPCSGKSSTAQALAGHFGLRYYNCDDAFFRHAGTVTPEQQPAFHRVTHYSPEELWMRPVADLLADELAVYREEFPLIVVDLLALPVDRPVIAEGAALLPELVAPLLAAQNRAVWMLPTPDFQWQHYRQRDWASEVVKDCSDPAQAFRNWMERDVQFARQVRGQADRLGLLAIKVDGSQDSKTVTAQVQMYFDLKQGCVT